jgi:hypothetical protein
VQVQVPVAVCVWAEMLPPPTPEMRQSLQGAHARVETRTCAPTSGTTIRISQARGPCSLSSTNKLIKIEVFPRDPPNLRPTEKKEKKNNGLR